jgi:hypothetical protein
MAGKFSFIHICQMVLPMYLSHYVQENVYEKYPATSNYGHTLILKKHHNNGTCQMETLSVSVGG